MNSFMKDALQIVSTEIWFSDQKNVDSRRQLPISLCNSGLISNKEIHAKNREHAFTNLFNFFAVLDRRASLLVFPVKSSVWLYSDRKPRACQKLGVGPGVDKLPAPGQRKICKCPTPGTDKAGKCPVVALEGGRGEAGRSWNWLMHYSAINFCGKNVWGNFYWHLVFAADGWKNRKN